MTARKPVFFFGPLPPPIHGMAMVNAQMVGLIAHYAPVIVSNLSPGGLVRGLVYHFRKSARVLAAVGRVPIAKMKGAKVVYGSPDDSWGGLWTIAILITARLFGMHIYLHHHSYRYLTKPTALMRLVTSIAGKAARHIVLGQNMADKLISLYPAVRDVKVCENSVLVLEDRTIASNDRKLTIGILANLTREKGALDFLELVVRALETQISVEAILAGPVPDIEVQKSLDSVLDKYPDAVEHRGPVYGMTKEQFFADIDLFIFPTRYPTEAFPLVLMEALVRGVPVVSFERGCIGQLRDQEGVTLIDCNADFIEPTLEILRTWDIAGRRNSRRIIADAARIRNAGNYQRLNEVAASIAGFKGTA